MAAEDSAGGAIALYSRMCLWVLHRPHQPTAALPTTGRRLCLASILLLLHLGLFTSFMLTRMSSSSIAAVLSAALVGVIAALAPAREAAADDGCMTTLGTPRRFTGPALQARIARTERAVLQSSRRSAIWAGVWGTAFATAAAGSLGAAATTHDEGLRKDLYVAGASATFGALLRVVMFPKPVLERRALRRQDLTDPCERMQAAEQALVRSARWERAGRRPFIHFASLGYSASVALIHGLVLQRPFAANRQFAIGAVVGQTFLLSTPRLATRELGLLSGRSKRVVLTHVRPFRLGGGAGLQAGGKF